MPATPDATQTLLEQIGPIRNTHYGTSPWLCHLDSELVLMRLQAASTTSRQTYHRKTQPIQAKVWSRTQTQPTSLTQ